VRFQAVFRLRPHLRRRKTSLDWWREILRSVVRYAGGSNRDISAMVCTIMHLKECTDPVQRSTRNPRFC